MLPMLKVFSKDFILVGGTAIALHLGHRRSIDFDLFCIQEFKSKSVQRKILRHHKIDKVYRSEPGEYTLQVKGVKMTFFEFGHVIEAKMQLDHFIHFPDLLTLAAMKAFALGFRGKWKNYVDLYFIIKGPHSIDEISEKAKKIFKGEYNERILREQLSYFEDISYKEKIEFLPGFEVSEKIIKKALIKFSLS